MKIQPGMRFICKNAMGKMPPLFQVVEIINNMVYYRRVEVKNNEESVGLFMMHFDVKDADKIVSMWVK
jgi:hypothetical protein